jgi:hypothetical protein
MNYREIDTIVAGAGVPLVRVIGAATVKDFDPFLMLDAFDSFNPGGKCPGGKCPGGKCPIRPSANWMTARS